MGLPQQNLGVAFLLTYHIYLICKTELTISQLLLKCCMICFSRYPGRGFPIRVTRQLYICVRSVISSKFVDGSRRYVKRGRLIPDISKHGATSCEGLEGHWA